MIWKILIGGIEMVRVEKSVVINRPIEEVFTYVANPMNSEQWAGPVTEAKQTSEGPVGVGTTSTRVTDFLGRKSENEYVVTEYEPYRKFAEKTISGPLQTTESITFENVEGGTKVTVAGEVEASGFIKLAEPVFARMAKRQLETDTSNLKDLMEAQGEAVT
jgi:uncharacterized protein YndB with AHSA1/START domain